MLLLQLIEVKDVQTLNQIMIKIYVALVTTDTLDGQKEDMKKTILLTGNGMQHVCQYNCMCQCNLTHQCKCTCVPVS